MASITKLASKRYRLSEIERKNWLAEHQINEESLTEELKYLIECKYDLPIWHKDREIIQWMKTEKEAGRINLSEINPLYKEKTEIKEETKDTVKKIRAKLILKERLKDRKDHEYLSLTFENFERKITVFPNSFPWKWSELKVGNNYSLIYSYKENTLRDGALISFKKVKEPLKENYFPLQNGEIEYNFDFDNDSSSSLNNQEEFKFLKEDIKELNETIKEENCVDILDDYDLDDNDITNESLSN